MEGQGQIFEDFKAGKMQSFYDSTYPLLIAFAARLLGPENAFLAEDCVQEAIFKTYQNRDKIENIVQLKSYVYVAVRHHAISVLRKKAHHDTYLKELQMEDGELEATMALQEALNMLYHVVKKLPENMQQLFKLNIEEGLKLKEVAVQMNMSEGGIKKLKARMVDLLRQRFKENEEALMLIALLMV